MLGFPALFPGAYIHEVLLWAWELISCSHTSLKGNLMWNSPAAWQNLSASPRLTHTPQPTSPSSYSNRLLPIFSIMLFLKCIYVRPANNQIHLQPERTVQKEKRKESKFLWIQDYFSVWGSPHNFSTNNWRLPKFALQFLSALPY